MTTSDDARSQSRIAFHRLLLWLAGKAPDALVAQARGWLAEGREGAAAQAVTATALAEDIPLPDADIALLGDLLDAGGVDTAELVEVAQAQFDPVPPFSFRVTAPGVEPPARPDDAPLDDVDRQALAAAAEQQGVRGVWRAWRYSAGTGTRPPRRIYLIEVDEEVDAVETTARLQRRLEAAGETDPQVEVYPVGADLPTYQRLARGYAQLLWARSARPDIRVAAVFDEVDARTGPRFSAQHGRLGDEIEARKVIGYLLGGEPLLVTAARMDDVVDRSRRNAVPMNFRTDGTWIWTDTVTYYLEQHRLVPDAGLLDHIRSAGYRMAALDGVAIHRAMAVLQQPPDEDPVWTFDGSSRDPEDVG